MLNKIIKFWKASLRTHRIMEDSLTKGFIYLLCIIFLFIYCMSGDNKNDVVARVGNAVLYRNELQKRIAWEGLKPDQERI